MGKNNRHWHNKKPSRPASDYKPPYSEDILNMSVEGLNLSVETLEVLQKGGIHTVGDILSRRKNDMYKVQSFNKKKLFEVSNAIAPLGVDFRPDEPRPASQDARENKGENRDRDRQGGDRREKTNDRREGEKDRRNDRNDASRGEKKGNDRPRDNAPRQPEPPRQGERNRDNRREDRPSRNEQGQNNNKQGKNAKQDNSVDFSKIFPREKLVHSPRIEMQKDRFTKFQRAGKWGYKDETGKEVIPPIYTEALNFKEDMAAVEMNGLFGYINRENVLVIPYKYDTAGSFSEGWANVSLGEKCGYVDVTGKETVPFIYDAATPFTGEGYARVKKDGRWGNITKNGEVSWQ